MALPPNALYTGGYSPGAQLFGVDGDWTFLDPAGLPIISYPMIGDSILSISDIVVYSVAASNYVAIKLGTAPNIQPWSANQQAFVIEQEFTCAQSAIVSLNLNTPYYLPWSTGWSARLGNGITVPPLNAAILVENGPHYDMGGGLVKFKMKFASIPPTRNEIEQYEYTYPGFDDSTTGASRVGPTFAVASRLQFDYFLFDDLDILSIPLYPAGIRLDASTGIRPNGLMLPAQYYASSAAEYAQNAFLVPGQLQDAAGSDVASIPGFTPWVSWATGAGTSNGLPAEIIAEASTLKRYMGNIWERRTRFVPVI